MSTFLQGIAKKAQAQPQHRFGNLYELLNEAYLKECWADIRRDAASGVDHVSAAEYAEHLDENIHDLVERLKRKQYRAKLVRRQYIPKANGKLRPLGIPAVEDKLLQLAVARILQAIYEQDFLQCSYGYREGRCAQDAVVELTVKLQFGRYNWVVEADIQGFYDNIQHEWLMRMLAERIEDGAFLRLIGKWLKAGVLDTDGQVLHPATGTPQGGIVSPVLANVYLHYALDLWFERVVKPRCRGAAYLIRYADDFVCVFEHQAEADQFYTELNHRLGQFGLQVAADKTRVIAFGRKGDLGATSFEFLGFEYRWGRNRSGRPQVQRRTAPKRLRASRKRMADWCRTQGRGELKVVLRGLNAKLRGYYNYYGLCGNYASLNRFYQAVMQELYKWLNRRSQRRSYTWWEFQKLLRAYGIARPRIVEKQRRWARAVACA
jgi:RNA-directed DNA polymerase